MKKLSALLLAGIFLIACKKENGGNNTCAVNKTNIVGDYKIASVRYKTNATAAEADYANFPACEKDNVLHIKTGGRYLFEDAGQQCTPTGEGEGDWILQGNILKMDELDVNDADEAIVETFECNGKMVLLYKDYDADNDQLRITLIKQ